MLAHARRSGMLLALALALALAPAAAHAAPAAPELFVAEGDSLNPQSTPSWVPLNGARMTGAGRYRLGVRLQANADTLHRAYLLIRAASAPRTPERGSAVVPGAGNCASVRGNAGDIVAWGTASYFGDGPYSLTAVLADYAPGPCPATGSPATSGTFTADARPAVAIVDSRSNDSRPAGPFRGARIVLTADANLPEAICARDPVLQPDGSLKGTVVTRSDDLFQDDKTTIGFREAEAFPEAGRWACVARALGGPDNIFSAWSAPVFATLRGEVFVHLPDVLIDRTYPTYAVRFHVDRGAAGGFVTFSLRSCRRYSRNASGRRLSNKRLTLRARVDRRGNALVRFTRKVPFPQFGRYFVGPALFSGNSLIPKGRTRNLFAFSEFLDTFDGPLLGIFIQKPC